MKAIDMTRQQVGALRVIWRAPQAYTGDGIHVMWTTRCACGTVVSVRGDSLRQRTQMSCGCMRRAQAVEHEARVRRDEIEEWQWTN